MRASHLGSLWVRFRCTDVALAAGFTPAATMPQPSAKRRLEWLIRKVPTIYRKESSPCGAAARAMRGNHLGSLSYFSAFRLVARDEQIDQDDREGAVLEDHVAGEAVLDGVADQAAVDVPREQQHQRERAC